MINESILDKLAYVGESAKKLIKPLRLAKQVYSSPAMQLFVKVYLSVFALLYIAGLLTLLYVHERLEREFLETGVTGRHTRSSS